VATVVGEAVRLKVECQGGETFQLTFSPERESEVRALVPILGDAFHPEPVIIEVVYSWGYQPDPTKSGNNLPF
jgi:hypothetical protein